MQETLNNELFTTLEKLIDKFNLTLEVSSTQLKEFSDQLATKIVVWELVQSIVLILVFIGLGLLIRKLEKTYIKESFKSLIKMYGVVSVNTNNDRLMGLTFAKIVTWGCYLLFIGKIIQNTVDIVLCIVFPEKIILDFISNYI